MNCKTDSSDFFSQLQEEFDSLVYEFQLLQTIVEVKATPLSPEDAIGLILAGP